MIEGAVSRTLPTRMLVVWAVFTVLMTFAFLARGSSPSGGAVPFVHITDSPLPPEECATFAATYGGGATWEQAKFDGSSIVTTGGTETVNGLTVTITFTTLPAQNVIPVFDWSASQPVDAVYVKVGDEGYLYLYNPEASSDTGLTSPKDSISHITFCFDTDPPTSSSTSSTSTSSTSSTTSSSTSSTSTSSTSSTSTSSTSSTTTTTTTTTQATTSTIETVVLPEVEVAQPPDPAPVQPTFTG